MVVLGRGGAGKDFANEIDDGITTCAKFTNNFKLPSGFLMVREGWLLGRLIGDETKDFTEKGNSLADNITVRKNVLYERGHG